MKTILMTLAQESFQIDALNLLSDWPFGEKQKSDWLRAPSFEHQFENPTQIPNTSLILKTCPGTKTFQKVAVREALMTSSGLKTGYKMIFLHQKKVL